MTYHEALAHISARSKPGIHLGLEAIRTAAEAFDSPQDAFETIHIAGTNGKGSTATMIARMLTACGHKTGLFTSPAVTSLCDTMQIDGVSISEEEFAELTERLLATLPCPLSEFEFTVLLMFYWFRKHGVDIAVIECGMGGETDATNLIAAPLCAVFTPIALDHAAFLGDTVTAVASQKSGIIKPGCDVVCASSMDDEALGVIFEKAASCGVSVHLPTPVNDIRHTASHTVFPFDGETVALTLYGDHQCDNAATALTVMRCLQKRGKTIDLKLAINALSAVSMPCRLEIIQDDPLIILDGAHNPHGIEALHRAVAARTDSPITLVIGMLRDKDHHACLRMLAPLAQHIVCCTPPDTPRALPAREFAAVAAHYHNNVTVVDDPTEAFLYAKKANDHAPIVVGGSFYTSSAVRRALFS